MSNLAQIQPQRVDFDTQQTCDWLDTLPVIGDAGAGGVIAGAANVGNGALVVASVAPGTPLSPLVVTVTQAGALPRLSVTDIAGTQMAVGLVGLPLYAAGVTFTLGQGATPFEVGDSFAIGVLPQPVDLTGLRFDFDARVAVGSKSYALQASTEAGTILNGGASGIVAMRVPLGTMNRCAVRPEGYPYSILATDPATGLTVPAFYGLIHHVAVAAQIGQA